MGSLSYVAAVAIAEIIVIVYEASFMTLLSQGQLSVRIAGIMSLLMNSASLGVGLLLLAAGNI